MWKSFVFVALAGLAASSAPPQVDKPEAPSAALAALLAQTGCAPALNLTPVAEKIVRIDGMGNASMPGASAKADAQSWFDYGLTLAHAFQHQEAIAAFQEAQRLDPSCALCVWGEAWGMGPTINYGIDAGKRAAGAALLQKASVLAADAPDLTKALIAATQKRTQPGDAKLQDIAFADAMDKIAVRNPQNVEVDVLAADAWLIANYWHGDQRGFPRAMNLLEGALKQKPDDVGALHFYIHAAEMAGQAGKALGAAQKLPAMAPLASHLIHMPAHVYYRTGEYKKATSANMDAIGVGAQYAKLTGFQGSLGNLGYYGHNLNYGMSAALIAGDQKAGLALAKAYARAYPDFTQFSIWQQLEATKFYVVKGRFAPVKETAGLPQPKPALLRAMWRYARGEASVRSGDAKAARAEAAQIKFSADDKKAFGDMAEIAQGILDISRLTLEGRIAMLEKNWPAAIDAFNKAAKVNDEKLSSHMDPAWWWGSPRRYGAIAYIKSGKPAMAKEQAEQALKAWPNDPAALFVLGIAQSALGDAAKSAANLKAARAGWAGDPALLRLDAI